MSVSKTEDMGSSPTTVPIIEAFWGGRVRLRDEAMPKGPDTAVEEAKAEK